ncbi:MAG: hypothetical protein ACOYMW_12750 [Candidatus Competibacteraceae bacterium]
MSFAISDYQKLVQPYDIKDTDKIDIQEGNLKTTPTTPQTTNVVEHLKTALEACGLSAEQINSALSVLPKGSDLTVADLKKVLKKLESFEKEMNMNKDGAMAGAFDLASLLTELQKVCLDIRKNAQAAAKAESDLQVKMTHEQANQIANAAGWALAAGIVSGSLQIASGATQVVGAVASVGISSVVGGGIGGSDGMVVFKLANSVLSSTFKGITEVTSGLGKIAEAGLNYGSQLTHAVEVWAQSEATKAGANREEQLKFAENMQEAVRAAIQALEQQIRSREQVVQKVFA